MTPTRALLVALTLSAITGLAGAPADAKPKANPAQALHAVIADFDRYQRQADPISAALENDRAALIGSAWRW